MSYSEIQASLKAMELVTISLQNGAITLNGSHKAGTDFSEDAAIADAKYLGKLLTDLTAVIQKLP